MPCKIKDRTDVTIILIHVKIPVSTITEINLAMIEFSSLRKLHATIIHPIKNGRLIRNRFELLKVSPIAAATTAQIATTIKPTPAFFLDCISILFFMLLIITKIDHKTAVYFNHNLYGSPSGRA